MSEINSVVAIYETHTQAEEAVKELQKSGFDMKKMSIVGKDYHTDEHVVGYYNTGDRMKYWGKMGAFWGGIWGLLFGAAFFFIPGIGPISVRPPVGGLDRGRPGRRGCGGRIERARRSAVQHGHPQEQHRDLRDGAQIRQVPPGGSRHCGGGRQSQGHSADHAPDGGWYTLSRTPACWRLAPGRPDGLDISGANGVHSLA